MIDAPAVSVQAVSKEFRLPHEQVHTLKERALHPFRRTGEERFQALENVTFDVAPGEFFGIVGRNGSEKSTLLKCLAGIYRVDQGQIRMRGRLSTFIELGVGFNADLPARDIVLINGIMLGLTPREALRRFDRIIEFAELEEFVDLKLKNYSSGMHVRLAFSARRGGRDSSAPHYAGHPRRGDGARLRRLQPRGPPHRGRALIPATSRVCHRYYSHGHAHTP